MAAPLAQASAGAPLALLSPGGLWLLALLGPLVLLYILKIKRSRRRVPSTWLWAAAQRDLMARAPFRKLIAQLPLVLQALALALLALALARPASRGRELTGDHVAIVLDTSASMSAAARGPAGEATTRIELAKQLARDLLSGLAPGSDALIVEAGRDARLVAALDRDLVRLKAAIDPIAARDVEGDLGAAVALGIDRLRQLGGARRVVAITDGNLARPASLRGASLPVEVITVGAPVDNAAIVRVDVRSGSAAVDVSGASGADGARSEQREEVQAFLVVANFGAQPRDVYVTMRQDNASDVLGSRRVLVKPGERLPVVVTFRPSPGDYRKGLVFELSPRDAMPLDDVAYGRVPAGDKLPVFLASAGTGQGGDAQGAQPGAPSGGSVWLERALASDPMTSVTSGALADLLGKPGLDPDTFVVIDGACPPDPPGGDLLIVNPPPGRCAGTLVGQTLERPTLTSWDTADPRLRFLTLDGVNLRVASSLKPEAATQELIRAQEGTIATDISTASRTGTLLGFDVGESDWPLKASFVLFVRNLIEQARAHRAHGITGPARTGEPLRVSVPATARDLQATGPAGERIEVAQRAGVAVIAETPRAGFYRLAWQGPQAGSVVVPANLTSVAESDLTPRPLVAEGGGEVAVSSAAGQPDAHVEWTWVLALAALGFVLFDVWYFTRVPLRS
ncbi:vWA domain-containing protein [Sorangium atrum]|uniref:VWA domain-containing protein n=1 Tax=Sorangium atrum TaxID=2995308 RepID=A0ABT5C3K6_9BACT|nr:VWA domain-containing protein [Sorangium aterium]MDC0680538.1 VWA domain-containing protein [Sorangium aterium]